MRTVRVRVCVSASIYRFQAINTMVDGRYRPPQAANERKTSESGTWHRGFKREVSVLSTSGTQRATWHTGPHRKKERQRGRRRIVGMVSGSDMVQRTRVTVCFRLTASSTLGRRSSPPACSA